MVTLFVCGDVMLARGIDQILGAPCDPTLHEPYMVDARDYIALAEETSGPIPRRVGPEYPWGDALAVIEAVRPDARIINLETSITRSNDWDRDKQIHYRVSPENAACLAVAGIDACALGNNHVLDWGSAGLLDTLGTLDRMHVAWSGAGRDLEEAIRPALIDLGPRGRIAVFSVGCRDAGVPPSWSAGARRSGVHTILEIDDPATAPRLRHAIDPWRSVHTTIVLSIHWGANWGFEVPDAHRRFAHRMIQDAGVHVVHGHSSHHVKGIEVHHGQPILYGCGDLITDYEGIRGHEDYRGDLGLLYLITLEPGGSLDKLEMVPTRMRRFRLNAAHAEETRWLAATLARCGAALGTSVELDGERLRLMW